MADSCPSLTSEEQARPLKRALFVTTFFDLARDLRRKILLETYDVESDTSPKARESGDLEDFNTRAWKFREHKQRIDAWTEVLREVEGNDDLVADVDSVKQKWLDELLVVRKRNEKTMEETWSKWCLEKYDV